MSMKKVDCSVELPQNIDLADPDDVEIRMLEYAHTLSVSDNKDEASVGRGLKLFLPAFCEMLRQEERPAYVVNSLLNSFGLILGMMLVAGSAPGKLHEAASDLADGIKETMFGFVKQCDRPENSNGGEAASTTNFLEHVLKGA